MVHIMLILPGQLHMLLLVLLLYMIIQAPCMQVSSFLHTYLQFLRVPCRMLSYLAFGMLGEDFTRGMGKKVFVGRLPQEATTDDLRQYFGRFGRILDVYIPKV